MNRRQLLKSALVAALVVAFATTASARTVLTADLTLSAADFASLQAAADAAINGYDTQGHNITITVCPTGSGTYATGAIVSGPLLGGGVLKFLGPQPNVMDAAVCIVHGGMAALYGARVDLHGFLVDGNPNDITLDYAIWARFGGMVTYGMMQVGRASAQIYADRFGYTEQVNDTGITASAVTFMRASHGGNMRMTAGVAIALTDLHYLDTNGVYSQPILWASAVSDITITGTASFSPWIKTVTGWKAAIYGSTLQWSGHTQASLMGDSVAVFTPGGTWIGD